MAEPRSWRCRTCEMPWQHDGVQGIAAHLGTHEGSFDIRVHAVEPQEHYADCPGSGCACAAYRAPATDAEPAVLRIAPFVTLTGIEHPASASPDEAVRGA